MAENTIRRRAGSIQQVMKNVESDLTGAFLPDTPSEASTPLHSSKSGLRAADLAKLDDQFYESHGLWTDIKTLAWMRVPSSSFKLLSIPVVFYVVWSLVSPQSANPFAPLLFISHYIPDSSPSDPRYAKGWLDIPFLLYYVIVFSFIRQFVILKIIKPFSRWWGIKKAGKVDRLGEQGYAILYWGTMGVWGLTIMGKLPTWFYRTEYFWIDYPHWRMQPDLKYFYLLQFSYWLQQLLVLALRLEKPRVDFKELVIHHIVTLWLIGWSYGINLTYIGNAVYVSMDLPDAFLAFSKACHYLGLAKMKVFTFVVFALVWTYFRHWLNFVIMWSVWTQFKFIPEDARRWAPLDGVWMVQWMKYQIFIPILLLQFLNLFWYYFVLRIAYRAVAGMGDVEDDRSEGDASDDEDD